jgi:FixJ family two-component response regulator
MTPPQHRISIVEDDASLRKALTFALETDRYAVASYRNGASALQDRRACDCVVVDLRLPDTDGLTLIDDLRRDGVDAPAILITTNPDDRCRRRAAAAGVAIVEKPLLGPELSQHIASAIAVQRARRPPRPSPYERAPKGFGPAS